MLRECTGCHVPKPEGAFAMKLGRRRTRCKSCINSYMSARYVKKRTTIRAAQKKYARTHASTVAAQQKRWREAHKDHIRNRHGVYRKNNPEKVKLPVKAHRAAKRGAKNELRPGEWEAMVEACGNRCIVPDCETSPVTQDHVIPLSKGGRHHISNLQPLCSFHNSSKGTKTTDYRGAK